MLRRNVWLRLQNQFQKALGEVEETFQFYVSMLEERKAEVSRELERAFSNKQVLQGKFWLKF